ncbi:MAG: radical SAM protein [Firmicutes bacterium]|nr:radical SAM protein [Bacillota bacterium]
MKDLKELRIQVTRRNKFPRLYDFDLLEDMEVQLSAEEIVAAAEAAAQLGIKEIRFTGGEPAERKDITELVGKVKAVEGIEKLSMTTNGIFLMNKVQELKDAGLDSVDILLDTFFEEKYIYMTGGGPIDEAMDGMEAAVQAGFKPVRVQATVIEGLNDDEILTFGQFALNEPIDVIFVEKPNKDGEKLKDSDKDQKFMAVEKIREKFKGVVNVPYGDPMVEAFKWFEAKGKVGFVDLEKSKNYGAEITADGKFKKALIDEHPKDISAVLSSLKVEDIKTAIENNL